MPVSVPLSGPGWLVTLATAAAAVLIVWALRKPFLALMRFVRTAGRVLDDVTGEPAHGGRPATPGLMERLGNVESAAAETGRKVGEIWAEISPNGGQSPSVRDTLHRIEVAVVDLGQKVGGLRGDVDQLKADKVRFHGDG